MVDMISVHIYCIVSKYHYICSVWSTFVLKLVITANISCN